MMNPLPPRPAQKDDFSPPWTNAQSSKRRKHSHHHGHSSSDTFLSPYSSHHGPVTQPNPVLWPPQHGMYPPEGYPRSGAGLVPLSAVPLAHQISRTQAVDSQARFSSFLHPREADYIPPMYQDPQLLETTTAATQEYQEDFPKTEVDHSAHPARSEPVGPGSAVSSEANFKIPFAENAKEFISSKEAKKAIIKEGKRNGYVKFGAVIKSASPLQVALPTTQPLSPRIGPKLVVEFEYTPTQLEVQVQQQPQHPDEQRVTLLPPPADFGYGVRMEADDKRLLKFYFEAWCNGRTILPGKSNSWKFDLGPMFSSNATVRHALLSLAGIYVLDYIQNEDIRVRTNSHYAEAVRLLEQNWKDPKKREGDNGDALVAAITLLNMHDVVMWENRRGPDRIPRWLEGAQMGAEILSQTDPGCRYWKRKNIQISKARRSNTITIGRAKITALIVTPLDGSDSSMGFQWLLSGDESDVDRIHAACGYSPKLMHCLAHITHLAVKVHNNPQSRILPQMVEALESKLTEIRQWSEISKGHDSLDSLLATCMLDETGVVTDAASMTDLTAEAWRTTARIYLRCRVSRLPRKHPEILKLTDDLSQIIRRMPCVGELFTAQAPFLPVWILGLISTQPEHRAVADRWFNNVINATDCRSSVPPAWGALQRVREWADENLNDEGTLPSSEYGSEDGSVNGSLFTSPIVSPTIAPPGHDGSLGFPTAPQFTNGFAYWPINPQDRWTIFDRRSISQRSPWWEEVVQHITSTEGTLCLI